MSLSQYSIYCERAAASLVGGVNSPLRANKAADAMPVFGQSGSGSQLTDSDGNTYVDCIMAYGPLLLGHAHPAIVAAIQKQSQLGTVFGTCSALEADFAHQIQSCYPSMEKIRLVNSGAEATLNAIRLAKHITGRSKVIHFRECYHGHIASESQPDRILCSFNDSTQFEALMHTHRASVAAVILEPVCGNLGVIAPEPGFLESIRAQTQAAGTLLIFDEVMTGFRTSVGGAQAYYTILPDLTCLAKVVGGGLPCAALGGRSDLMMHMAPAGPLYQAGTFNGNPLCMAVGIAAIQTIKQTQASEAAAQFASGLAIDMRAAIAQYEVPLSIAQVGSMLSVFFSSDVPRNAAQVQATDHARFPAYYRTMKANGVLIPPSPFEAYFVSSVHTPADHAQIMQAFRAYLADYA